MKSMRMPRAVNRFSFTGSLILGAVLLLLAPAQAGVMSADEQSLFNLADDDRWHDKVQALLAKGVSPNVLSFESKAAMHAAAEGGAVQNLAAMLQAGGDPNLPDGEGNTPLHWASANRGGLTTDAPAAIWLLVQHGAALHRTNRNGATPLHVAVYTGVGSADGDVVKALLDAGAQPETVDGAGLTALQRFARDGDNQGKIATLLLRAGASPDRKTPGGDAPLHLAIKHGGSSGKADVVDALLDGGANPCVRDADGHTPYHMSHTMTRIHQTLDRVQGFDASHPGATGCPRGGDAEAPALTDKGGPDGAGDAGESEEAMAPLQPFGPNWIVAENQPCQRFNPNPHPGETYTWSGGCVDGKVSGEGRGVWHLPDGSKDVYEGSMRAGKQHGQGIHTWANGDRYEGQWREGKVHGQGIYTFADGDRYEGQWDNGCFREDYPDRWATVGNTKDGCGF